MEMETLKATPEFVQRNSSHQGLMMDEEHQRFPDARKRHLDTAGEAEQPSDNVLYSSRKRPLPCEPDDSRFNGHLQQQQQKRGPRQDSMQQGRWNDTSSGTRGQPEGRYGPGLGDPSAPLHQQGPQRNMERPASGDSQRFTEPPSRPRNGHDAGRIPPPPPPPRNSPLQNKEQNASGWSSQGGHDHKDGGTNNSVFCGPPEPKRPRCSNQGRDSLPVHDFTQRWQPNRSEETKEGVSYKEQKCLSESPALEDISDESQRAFAGRFVPKGGTSESFEKLRADKERSEKQVAKTVSLASKPVTTLVQGEKEPTSVACGTEVVAACLEDAIDNDNSKGQQGASNDVSTKPETMKDGEENMDEKVVFKLPSSLKVEGHSLKDIVKDTITPELTDASADTELRASASYSSCSLPHASVTTSVDIMESPHSLSHPDDATVESYTREDDKKPATSVFIDLPTVSSGERTNEEEGTAEKEAPRDIVVEDSVFVEETRDDAEIVETVAAKDSKFDENEANEPSPAEIDKSESVVAQTLPPPRTEAAQGDSSDSSDDETDEEELQEWARKMFGIPPPIAVPAQPERAYTSNDSSDDESKDDVEATEENRSLHLTLHLKVPPTVIPKKSRRRRKSVLSPRKKKRGQRSVKPAKAARKKSEDEEMLCSEEARRKKEEAKPLTAAEVRKILAEDEGCCATSHWVRRSMRQPSRSVLHNPSVRSLIDKLRVNDYDMVVLKMKKYCPDPDTPTMVINAVLDALEENTNCQALYIQNFNEGMRDEQVLHLLRILQMPSCNIWCLNIGETYNVKTKTWKLFAKGLKKTKITHMYASEHTISTALKDEIRNTIRKNRSKHDMHCNPDNLDVIVQCTHCWWNPINTKSLRPYLSKPMEHMLHDKEVQGLPGSKSLPAGDAGAVNGDS